MWRCFLLILPIIVIGCGDKRGDEPTAPSPAAEALVHQQSFAREDVRSLRVEILPKVPTVRDNLLAVVQGGGEEIYYSWEIDDKNLATGKSDRLPAGSSVKGQKVKVSIRSENREAFSEVTIANSPPMITSVPLLDSSIHAGKGLEVLPQAEDADGDSIQYKYRWFVNNDQVLFVDGSILPGDSYKRGDRVLAEIIPYDGEDSGSPFAAEELIIPNAPPVFISEPSAIFDEKGYHYNVRAEDPDQDSLFYFLKSGPSGLFIDAVSGLIRWDIEDIVSGEQFVSIGVQDHYGKSAYQEFTLNVDVK